MRNLSSFILDNQLIDLPLEGARYTWTNKMDSLILSRVDRILISKEWDEAFPCILQRALPRTTSDHNPILLEISDYYGGPKPFRFDLSLCQSQDFEEKIAAWWSELRIRDWVKDEAISKRFRKEEVCACIQILDRKEESVALDVYEKMERLALVVEHEEILRREEFQWRQKSRALWLKEGDNNSKFFHRMANARRRINSINSIKEGEALVEDKEQIKNILTGFFSKLYRKEHPWRPKLAGLHFRSLSQVQFEVLERLFTEEEVKGAIFSMNKDSART
ncbi:uncharacterized protein LOC143859029 [Tasmannia lanceolata]|uniref:uncharacterized protein LOC143859029 n=1 Tax=Tasmannia lanceolata TaxID=3420 RepID=UPI004064B152